MYIDEIMAVIENMENKTIEFYRGKRILKSTLNLVCHRIKRIREILREPGDDTFEREIVLQEISEELVVLNDLVRAMTVNIPGDAKALAHELLSTVTAEKCHIDLYLAELGRLSSPRIYYYREGNELTFFLFFPSVKYTTHDRIGLIAHETSHVQETVHKYTGSTSSEKRRIGESLADILGLYTAGPLFSHALSFIVLNDFKEHPLHEDFCSHPSWACRIHILDFVNSDLWETEAFKRAVHESLARAVRNEPPLPREGLFIALCLREYDRLRKEFSVFLLDEGRIGSLKNGEEESILCRLNTQYMR